MAKVMEGARSQLSGKADGLLYVQFNGGVYTRKLPKRKKEAWTKGMLQNLDRFKRVNGFCGQYSDMIKTGIVRINLGGTFVLPYFPMPQAPGLLLLYFFFVSANRSDFSSSECFEV